MQATGQSPSSAGAPEEHMPCMCEALALSQHHPTPIFHVFSK